MIQSVKLAQAATTLLFLAGCVDLSSLPVTQFDQAIHTAASAESAFYQAVTRLECKVQGAESQGEAARLRRGGQILLTGYCQPVLITQAQIQRRNAMLTAITVYADALQALAAPDTDNKALSDNTKQLATSLVSAASAGGLKGFGVSDSVEKAIVDIAQAALNLYRYRTIKRAAAELDTSIQTVVEALTKENRDLAEGIVGLANRYQNAQQDTLIRTAGACPSGRYCPDLYSAIGSARSTMQADVMGLGSATVPIPLPSSGAGAGIAKPINDALALVATGNHAIATAGPGSVWSVANEVMQRAADAKAFYDAVK